MPPKRRAEDDPNDPNDLNDPNPFDGGPLPPPGLAPGQPALAPPPPPPPVPRGFAGLMNPAASGPRAPMAGGFNLMPPPPPRAPAGYNPGPSPAVSQGPPKRQRTDAGASLPVPAIPPFRQPNQGLPAPVPPHMGPNPPRPPAGMQFGGMASHFIAMNQAPVPGPLPGMRAFKPLPPGAVMPAQLPDRAPDFSPLVPSPLVPDAAVPDAAGPSQLPASRIPVFNPPLRATAFKPLLPGAAMPAQLPYRAPDFSPLVPDAAGPSQLPAGRVPVFNPPLPAAVPRQLPAGRIPVFNPPLPAVRPYFPIGQPALPAGPVFNPPLLAAAPAFPIAQPSMPIGPAHVLAVRAPAGPLHPLPLPPGLILEMQKKSDRFFEYRKGRGQGWDEEYRKPIWQTLKLPTGFYRERIRELNSANSKMAQGMADADQVSRHHFRNVGERRLKGKNKAEVVQSLPRKAINDYSGGLLAAGARFVRLLGAGGNGAACLYEVVNQKTGAKKRIVVKMSLRGTDMRNEKNVLTWLKRCRHITQLATIAEVHEMLGNEEHGNPAVPLQLHHLNLDAETVDAIKKVDAEKSLLIQIFSDKGALDKMVALLARLRIPVRDKFCWRLLECLVRGCIAMWSPVRKQAEASGQPVPNWPPLIQEELPPMDELYLSNFVHFDLDPYNIFLTSDVDHPIMPMAQIGDFGATKPMHKDVLRENDFMMWVLRHTGKQGYLAPEQFTDQWDYCYLNPWKQLGKPKYKFRTSYQHVAGNYGWWTNVWAIGVTMWVVIMQRAPMNPPVPKEIPILPNMEADPGGDGRRTFWMYAHPLNEPGHAHISDTLRHLVVRMMADEPCDRPSLKELLEAAEAGCAAVDDDDPSHEQSDLETDANIKNYFDHFFDTIDPPPPDPVIADPARPMPSPPPVPVPQWNVPPGAGGAPPGAGGAP
ncbi:hypothetical protein RB601_006515 [Gaeumannomyces tritici]